MTEFKSGFVAMLGRTNVGKSTLVNLLVGEKVAATANKVQTTRTAIRGIANRENSVFNLQMLQNFLKKISKKIEILDFPAGRFSMSFLGLDLLNPSI